MIKTLIFVAYVFLVYSEKPTISSSFSALIYQNASSQINYYWLHQDFPNQRFRRDILNTLQHQIHNCHPQNSSTLRFNFYHCYASCLNGKNCKDQTSCNCRVPDMNKVLQDSTRVGTCQGQGHHGELYNNQNERISICVTPSRHLVYYIIGTIKYDVLDYVPRTPEPSLFNYDRRCLKCE